MTTISRMNNSFDNKMIKSNYNIKDNRTNPIVHNPFNTSYIIPNFFIQSYPHLSNQIERLHLTALDNEKDKQRPKSISVDLTNHKPKSKISLETCNGNNTYPYTSHENNRYNAPHYHFSVPHSTSPNFQTLHPRDQISGQHYIPPHQLPPFFHHHSAPLLNSIPPKIKNQGSKSTITNILNASSASSNTNNLTSTPPVNPRYGKSPTSSTPSPTSSTFIHSTMDTIEQVDNVAPTKVRKNLSKQHYSILINWLKEHLEHPYPNYSEKAELQHLTGLTSYQLSNFFINARRRKLPMLKRQAKRQKIVQARKD